MNGRPIQEQFGDRVIEAFADFARSDLKQPSQLEADEFSHIADVQLRRRLAEVFYGVRWIYKLGLALLTRDAERAAHVRAQIVDYASVTEGILSHCIAHALRGNHTRGTAYNYRDPDRQIQPIRWNSNNPEPTLNRQTYWWFIRIAREFGIINRTLETELEWLREQRNTVHLRQRSSLGRTAYLNQSKRAFTAVAETINQTKRWKISHS